MNLISRAIELYWRFLRTPEEYARHIGVNIGQHCFIATREWGSEPYLISVGDNVQVTRGVAIHCHGGGNAIRWKIPDYDVFGKVIIQDWAYIGSFSQIMPGVTIGKGAIVAAGSIVTKSVAPYTVVGGNPAKFICTIEEYINKNSKYNLHIHNIYTRKQKKEYLLSIDDDKFIRK